MDFSYGVIIYISCADLKGARGDPGQCKLLTSHSESKKKKKEIRPPGKQNYFNNVHRITADYDGV